jgi:hypothetical protein
VSTRYRQAIRFYDYRGRFVGRRSLPLVGAPLSGEHSIAADTWPAEASTALLIGNARSDSGAPDVHWLERTIIHEPRIINIGACRSAHARETMARRRRERGS